MVDAISAISSSQRIDAMNDALSRAVESRKQGKGAGRTYLVIDTKTGMIGTTSDKAQASSMKQVIATMNELSKEIFDDRGNQSLNRDSIKHLRSNFSVFMGQYENKERGFFGKIAHQITSFVNNFFKLNEQIHDNLDQRLAAYGLKEGETGMKVISYDKSQERIMMQRKMAEEGINQLDKIKDSPKLNPVKISKAFDEELFKEFRPNFSSDKAAFEFVVSSFDTVLAQFTDQVESKQLSPKEAAEKFLSHLNDHISKKNEETLEFDRETFRDLLGKHVKDGQGSKIPPSIDFYNPKLQQLIKDYNNDVWKEGEEKSLTQLVMNDETSQRMQGALNKTLDNETFKQLLTNYFTQISS